MLALAVGMQMGNVFFASIHLFLDYLFGPQEVALRFGWPPNVFEEALCDPSAPQTHHHRAHRHAAGSADAPGPGATAGPPSSSSEDSEDSDLNVLVSKGIAPEGEPPDAAGTSEKHRRTRRATAQAEVPADAGGGKRSSHHRHHSRHRHHHHHQSRRHEHHHSHSHSASPPPATGGAQTTPIEVDSSMSSSGDEQAASATATPPPPTPAAKPGNAGADKSTPPPSRRRSMAELRTLFAKLGVQITDFLRWGSVVGAAGPPKPASPATPPPSANGADSEHFRSTDQAGGEAVEQLGPYLRIPWTCPHCSRALLANKVDIEGHLERCPSNKSAQPQANEQPGGEAPASSVARRPFECAICSKTYLFTPPEILRHRALHVRKTSSS